MSVAPRATSAARLASLISLVTMLPLAVLLWLGWRLVQQDQLLQRQQIANRVDRGASLAVSGLKRALDDTRQQLFSGRRNWPEGAVAVQLTGPGVVVEPRERVSFLPVVNPLSEAPAEVFADAERLEFARAHAQDAMALYRGLSEHPDRPVRVGALLRLARTAQNAGRADEALEIYGRLVDVNDVGMNGVPAALIARYGRCRLLDRLARKTELATEATSLADALDNARWPLTRPVYVLYAADARRWSGREASRERPADDFGEAVSAVWEKWESPARPAVGNDAATPMTIGAHTFVVLWQLEQSPPSALIADQRFVDKEWMPAIAPVLESSKIAVALHTGIDAGPSRALADEGHPQRLRVSAETGLPWNLLVSTTDPPPEEADFAARRRLLAAGMVLLVLMASAASYIVVRAVTREMAVARLQSDFVAAVSHEFRTPLTSLKQFTEMLQDNDGLDDERRHVAYAAQARATQRLTRLVESLLDFGRMEAGTHRYVFASCDCAAVVRSVVDEVREETAGTGHTIELETLHTLPCEADEEALGRAVRNIVDNAIKYSPEPSPVHVRVEKRNDMAAITVADRGIGIPQAERNSVFARFHRGEEARIRGIKGTGIGLALVDEIVRAHGGRIAVVSEVGQGSTFTLLLPLSQGARDTSVSFDSPHLTWPES